MNQRKIIPMPLPGTDTPDVQPWEREHAAVARKAAAESFVLLKNEGNALPLTKGSRIAEAPVPEMSMSDTPYRLHRACGKRAMC